jgi:hypothetical protein
MNPNAPYRLQPLSESDYHLILSDQSLWRLLLKDLAVETEPEPHTSKVFRFAETIGLPLELVVGKLATLGYWSSLNMAVH